MNILVTGAWQNAQEHIAEIGNMGHEVCFMQYEKDELPCEYDWVEGVICNGLFLYHEIEKFLNLKYIQLTSAGYDRVPMDYVKEHGIEIHNAKGVYSIPMAEFAVAGVLSIYKKLDTFKEQQNKHQWIKQRDLLELNGKTVCIVGCGDVGRECAKRFSAFGCGIVEVHRDLQGMEAIRTADVVIVTIAFTDTTYHLIKPSEMRQGAILVSISRGAAVDQEDLIETLNLGKIYAVLDVFQDEPLDGSNPLWNMENVIVTPHNSFVGDGNKERLHRQIVGNINGTKSRMVKRTT